MRTYNFPQWLSGAITVGAIVATTGTASADGGLSLNRFYPAPAGDRLFGVQSPYALGAPGLHLMLLADYAHNPLVIRREGDDENVGAVVSDQLFLHLSGSVALLDRLTLNLDLPVAVAQAGNDLTVDGLGSLTSPSAAQVGDLRLGLRLRLLGEFDDPFQLALGGYVWLPTGNDELGSFVGDGDVRGMPSLIVGGRTPSLVWASSAGVELRPSQLYGQVAQGSMLHLGAGVGFLVDPERRLQIGPELTVAFVLEDANERTVNAEALLGAKYRFLDVIEAGLGVGPGLTSGIGTPDFRAVASIAYTPEPARAPADRDKDGIVDDVDACPDTPGIASTDPKKHGCPPPPDRDKDGIIDGVDACPDTAGLPSDDPKKNGCPPPPDRDKDGIIDDVDACPDTPGVASDDPKKNGCPPDADGDGIPDANDACRDIPGVASDDPAKNGCPPDTDGDTFRDDQDGCPREKGVADPDPAKNGCPKAVRVSETEIYILQQVQFDTNKTTIKPVSNDLLDEVAAVLKDHPEILRVEVQGHTDNRGGKAYNERLSQGRADAVAKALVARGIDAGRLTPKGYGQEKPIADNKDETGRQKNRRVQFVILEKKKAEQQQ